jgi:hypothetical protein
LRGQKIALADVDLSPRERPESDKADPATTLEIVADFGNRVDTEFPENKSCRVSFNCYRAVVAPRFALAGYRIRSSQFDNFRDPSA